jgi:GT2 family glycosyltransferase
MSQSVGFVVIGRNEGQRLIECLNSIVNFLPYIVYVDSASTDNSVQEALSRGVHVLKLDMSLKFTAARARNEGFKKIKELYPNIDYVHFLDGDCSVDQDWVNKALTFIVSHPAVAVVCGRRRERYPHVSAYNRMCDIEWDTPIGEAKACGGDALISTKVFHQVGGFKQDLIAGEEPELCIRIRQSGYKIWRLDGEMTSHDASILHFAQWWKRTMRAGYAFAEGSQLHGHAPEYHWVKESMRAWFWGAFMPMLWLVGLVFYPLLAWLIVFIFMLQLIKLIYKNKKFGDFSPKYASYTLLGKVAEVCGQIKYYWHHVLRSQSKIIEYK